MKQWIFSQNLYPQKLVIDKDTVVAITPYQLSLTNKIIVERDFLKLEIAEQNSMIGLQDSLLKSYGKQLERWKELDRTNQSIIEDFKLREIESIKGHKRHTLAIGGTCFVVGFSVGVFLMVFNQK